MLLLRWNGCKSIHNLHLHLGDMLSLHEMSCLHRMPRIMWRVVRPSTARIAHWRRESSTQASILPEPRDDDAETETETVQVEYRGRIMRVSKGSLLRSALLRNGASPHNGKAMYVNCRGLGTCGTCAVQVVGKVVPQEWGIQERLRFSFPPHHPSTSAHLRLACQVRVEEDMKVIKYNKFWGQGNVALGPLTEDDFKLPLGQLEYINDSDLPKEKKI